MCIFPGEMSITLLSDVPPAFGLMLKSCRTPTIFHSQPGRCAKQRTSTPGAAALSRASTDGIMTRCLIRGALNYSTATMSLRLAIRSATSRRCLWQRAAWPPHARTSGLS
jgi:hypothetical protein